MIVKMQEYVNSKGMVDEIWWQEVVVFMFFEVQI